MSQDLKGHEKEVSLLTKARFGKPCVDYCSILNEPQSWAKKRKKKKKKEKRIIRH